MTQELRVFGVLWHTLNIVHDEIDTPWNFNFVKFVLPVMKAPLGYFSGASEEVKVRNVLKL